MSIVRSEAELGAKALRSTGTCRHAGPTTVMSIRCGSIAEGRRPTSSIRKQITKAPADQRAQLPSETSEDGDMLKRKCARADGAGCSADTDDDGPNSSVAETVSVPPATCT